MTSAQATDRVVPDAETAPAPKPPKRVRRPLVWTRFRFGIQSKILVALLLSSILGVGVIGAIGAVSGRSALREVESERLIELRESQKRAVEALFREVTNSLIIYSGGFSINQAATALTEGFTQLANATITPAQQQALVNYYDNEMIQPIKRLTGDGIDLNAVLPSSNAQRYVQAYYTAPPRPTANSLPVADAGDGSAWSAANARFDFYMRGIVTRFDYRDALLLDMQGNVVYSVMKVPISGPISSPAPTANQICATHTKKLWPPTTSTSPGSPTFSRISHTSTSPRRGWSRRSA